MISSAAIFLFGGFGMADRAPVVSSGSVSQPSGASVKHHEGRGAWVLTAYGIVGLALFGVLAYFFSDFISH
ncbi:MAG: hypothetical protein DMG76_27520 [Acidobacteria bacterium]|jgi:hypothetical protein|nr:MAG: hypothetical protein DMG76_27520 [Acidobacteriota bacterium]